jgi:hypothetical protein
MHLVATEAGHGTTAHKGILLCLDIALLDDLAPFG